MRRITLWVLSTVSALVLLFTYHTSTAGTVHQGPSSAYVATQQSGTEAKAGAGGTKGSQQPRTVTGDVAQTEWGPVQVQLQIVADTITRAEVLQRPSGNATDEQINSYALPILLQETTDAQSADIDMVSGATVTSGGYLESLQSALDRAGWRP